MQIYNKTVHTYRKVLWRIFGLIACLTLFISHVAWSQDALIIKEGDVARGLVKGTDFIQVAFEIKEGQSKLYQAKDIQAFVWNGETYWSKPLLVNNKLTYKFYKAVESGHINLYTTGMIIEKEEPVVEKRPIKPRIAIGIGTGGISPNISFGRGPRQTTATKAVPEPTEQRIRFFIEKPGTGPLLELNFDFPASVKAQLGLKIQDNKEIFDMVKELNTINPEQLLLIIQKYNGVEPQKNSN